jgi:hypothetical protein
LDEALRMLGFRSLHWGGPEIRMIVERAAEEGRPLVEDLGDYEAFSDILALSTNFAVLDRQYPGSKFILTTRDADSWLDSRRRHVETNRALHSEGRYNGNFLTIDLDGWSRERAEHEVQVRSYFSERPADLLVMDIVGGDGWEVLCSFLGLPVPDAPFPRQR